MARLAVKLLLLDEENRLLLIHAQDPRRHAACWYPVGGGVEPGENLQEAAAREAFEETGLADLPPGLAVWRRDHRYEFDGRTTEVHEEWLLHRVARFDPLPTRLSEREARSIAGFRWWRAQELAESAETIFPPRLGRLLAQLLIDGVPTEPLDIGGPEAFRAAGRG